MWASGAEESLPVSLQPVETQRSDVKENGDYEFPPCVSCKRISTLENGDKEQSHEKF